MKTLVAAIAIGFLALNPMQVMAGDHAHPSYAGSDAFESMKQLVGSWAGTIDMGQGPQTITASYRLTAAGSAIVETVFEGAPHEMMSVYHDTSDRKLVMVHYCAEHNQPRLTLTSMTQDELKFDLAPDADVDVSRDKHIHAVVLRIEGKDKMVQRFTAFEGGKPGQVVEVVYTRTQ